MMDTMTETNAPDAQPLPIRDESIRLGQALKLASLVEDGAMARDVVTDGLVTVNGAVETRRGAQLHAWDALAPGLGERWVRFVEAYADDWEVIRRRYAEGEVELQQ